MRLGTLGLAALATALLLAAHGGSEARQRLEGFMDSGGGLRISRLPSPPAGRPFGEAEATPAGRSWSAVPARFFSTVTRPFHTSPGHLLLAAAVLLGVSYSVHRVRVGHLLQLERQRTRIAEDLHDAVGSGLGSIAILSDLAGRPGIPEERRRELAARTARVAGELESALSGIVWSLRPGLATLEALSLHLVERAVELFPGEATTFLAQLPAAWPLVRLSLPVRSNVLLIALEALHNAARHAGARRVILGVAPEGARVRLWVADDGSGMDPAAAPNGGKGMGRSSMRRRAEEIGAEIEISSAPGGGTSVTLVFRPEGGKR